MLSEDTKIKYVLSDSDGELYQITLELRQIEGSVPNFYTQLKKALGIGKDKSLEIIKRVIIEEGNDE